MLFGFVVGCAVGSVRAVVCGTVCDICSGVGVGVFVVGVVGVVVCGVNVGVAVAAVVAIVAAAIGIVSAAVVDGVIGMSGQWQRDH